MKPDGTLKGIVAGYRNWRDLYNQNTFAQDGGQQGIREHEDAVALYYALKRNADGMKNSATGQYEGISAAYRITAMPAYVVDPEKPVGVTVLVAEEKRKQAYENIAANMIKATTTRIPQPVPPGTTEAAVPTLENLIGDLPSKDYFLTTLDRPHYANAQDEEGNEIYDTPKDKPQTEQPDPAKPQRQVRNELRNDTPVTGR